MAKKNVGVFFGSRSPEHDISIVTAISSVINPLKLTGQYNPIPVYIAKDGSWYVGSELADISLYSSGSIDAYIKKSNPVSVSLNRGLEILQPGIGGGKRTRVDIAFPALHGTHGEDGELMGVFEMAGVPYVGCGVQASAIAMDKVMSKIIAQAHGILTPKFIFFSKHQFEVDTDHHIDRAIRLLRFPMFVKPAHLGSSIAITKVSNETELRNAIEVALHYDDKVLVEEGVENLIEVTQPIMGNDSLTFALLEEALPNKDGVFDFDTKYLQQGKGKSKTTSRKGERGAQGYSKLPSDLPDDIYEKAQALAKEVYIAVGCQGIARIDMLIDGNSKDIYFNEINPLPGSLYSHNWRAAGISNVQLVERLIELADERHSNKAALNDVFTTNFLKQFSGE